MTKKRILTPEQLRQILRYEPDTGKLFWLVATVSIFTNTKHSAERKCAAWNGQFPGNEALNYRDRDDWYAYGSILGTKAYAHRVIVAMHENAWPIEVDHIDGDKTNNRLSNLRSVTHQENAMNSSPRIDNRSGAVGVSWCERDRRWNAEIFAFGRKTFIGAFKSFDQARKARLDFEIKFGFHPNHGDFGKLRRKTS